MPDFPVRSICYLASSDVPSDAANSIHVVHMCQAMSDLGNKVTLIAPTLKLSFGDKSELLRKKYNVKADYALHHIWIAGIPGGGWIYRRQLSWVFQRAKPDFVYGRNLEDCLFAAQNRYETVLEVHMPIWMMGGSSERILETLIAEPTFKALVVISKALAEVYSKKYPSLKNKIIIAPDAAPEWQQKKRIEKPASKFRIVYVGGLYPGKGIEILIDLAPKCPWAEFIVVGGTESEIRNWQTRIPQATKNIVFVGRQPHANVYKYLISADVLVAPFQHHVQGYGDTWDLAPWMSPLKIFEYMAACRPMIVSDLPVIREVLEHKHNALLVDPEDVESWVQAIQYIRDNPDITREMAERAYSDYLEHYTWNSRAKKLFDKLQTIN